MTHTWEPAGTTPIAAQYIRLQGSQDALVRVAPMPDGRYLWQFRKVVSYAVSIDAAKNYVEAGAEYFETMHRNPYTA